MGAALSPLGLTGSISAALAGFDHHVRELFHFGGPPNIVQDSEGLQVLGYTAWGCRCFGVQGVVQPQHLRKDVP